MQRENSGDSRGFVLTMGEECWDKWVPKTVPNLGSLLSMLGQGQGLGCKSYGEDKLINCENFPSLTEVDFSAQCKSNRPAYPNGTQQK